MSDETSGLWLTLAQAAAERGLSEKTLRKRIAAGEVEGRKVPLDGGGTAWRVRPLGGSESGVPVSVPAVTEPRAGIGPEVKSTAPVDSQAVPVAERNIAPEVTGTRAGTAPELSRLSELRDEVKFLRALVEQRDRDAAELRAALRKALEAMPKAIAAPADTDAPQAPQSAVNRTVDNQPRPAPSGSQRPAGREFRPLWRLILGLR
jgi:hypothetical protein